MFFTWWMLVIIGFVWISSMLVHGVISFREGAESMVAGLLEAGYIKIDKDDQIIGLCNRTEDMDE